ncbi:hypothetical protein NT2_05_00180 [Caenibius tardaugens NBRC 16725]|uniref:Phage tail assembly chaperone n=1 Tax=Caenibius tardaugens NBRC 16725 TaxID=1219035 RepID=U2YL52_9SPHN|nr:phage tail assembly chaperone [Caenibius tardaugens]AZI36464.1 phage tail assembly chaperone [Caenibius tardaugens NBRC 16725]GAD49097.1 hypothetical protein NT2_05_00180 [Caenibius tardaugens NBRC 16725]
MNARFAEGALRLSGLVMRMQGWSPEAFWQATPAELAALFAPAADAPPTPLTRTDLTRLMESDHDRQSD